MGTGRTGKMCPENAKSTHRIATADRIRTIDFARSGIGGTGSLSPRARRTLAVYVVLIRMGYDAVSSPMGAIADAVHRSSHGEAGSIRTLQRANRELEKRGFIRCAAFRPGERARGALIWFRLSAFAYWTQKKTGSVFPLPKSSHNVVSREKMCDNSPRATSCHPPDRTSEKSVPSSQDPTEIENYKPRAGARAIKTSFRQKKNAVLFSLGCVLSIVGNLHRTDRKAARARADCEVKAIAGGVELVNPSGVDWAYWDQRWPDMPIAVRESTIRREILPLLLGRPTPPPAIPATSPPPEELEELAAAEPPPTAEQIRAVREALEERFTLPRESNPAPAPAPANYPEVDASDPDLRLLLEARERCRSRCVNGG